MRWLSTVKISWCVVATSTGKVSMFEAYDCHRDAQNFSFSNTHKWPTYLTQHNPCYQKEYQWAYLKFNIMKTVRGLNTTYNWHKFWIRNLIKLDMPTTKVSYPRANSTRYLRTQLWTAWSCEDRRKFQARFTVPFWDGQRRLHSDDPGLNLANKCKGPIYLAHPTFSNNLEKYETHSPN